MAWRRGVAYSQDLRDRVFARCDAGEAVGEIAEALCVTVSYVSKVLTRRSQTGELSARPQRVHVPPKLAGCMRRSKPRSRHVPMPPWPNCAAGLRKHIRSRPAAR